MPIFAAMEGGQRKLIITDDGSHSVVVQDLNVTYHSTHGAIRESKHVFIDSGFRYIAERFPEGPIHILEMGFGTGLNAFLTAIESRERLHPVRYRALETSPLDMSAAAALNYPDQLGNEEMFSHLHVAPWNSPVFIHDSFSINKQSVDLLDYSCPEERMHLVYFDAFAPEVQPHLWTEAVFRQIGACMNAGGVLVTYCSKGVVRRAMGAAGWTVEKLQGPPGKREMVRARWSGQ